MDLGERGVLRHSEFRSPSHGQSSHIFIHHIERRVAGTRTVTIPISLERIRRSVISSAAIFWSFR